MQGGYVLLDFEKIVGTDDFSSGLDTIDEGVEITKAQFNEIVNIIDYASKHKKNIKTHFYAYDGCYVNSINSYYYDIDSEYIHISYIDINDSSVSYNLTIEKHTDGKYYIGIITA